jgi:adenylate cyclase
MTEPTDTSIEPPDQPRADQRVDLRDVLLDLGVSPAEIDRAVADGTLELLALQTIVSLEEPRYDLEEVAALSGVDPEQIASYWRALGFPDPRPGEKLFTDTDIEMLSAVVSFIAEGTLEPDLALQMARVIGAALDKVATAQVDAMQLRKDAAEDGETPAFPIAPQSSAELLSLMPKVIEFVWRRQLAAAARRRMMRAAASEDGTESVVVGFADLVGFTAKTQQLDEAELAEVVGRFEEAAYDVVNAHGGRVVKMIGDEVMFLHDDPCEAAKLALELAEHFRDDPNLSDLRVGMARGPVLERDGDVYGHVVNLANRIVSIAYPATVVVSEEVADALRDDDSFVLRSIRSHYLRDIGRVPLWTLRRAADQSERPYSRARRRRARREFLRERWIDLQQEAQRRTADLPEPIPADLLAPELAHDPTTDQFEALSEAVLEADLDEEAQVALLSDLEAARRLRHLEHEAETKAAEADTEAERQLEEIEIEAREKIEEVEREARRRIDQLLLEAEEKSRKVNEQASRKVQRVAEDVERKAERATKDAAKEAKARAERRAKRRNEAGAKKQRKKD